MPLPADAGLQPPFPSSSLISGSLQVASQGTHKGYDLLHAPFTMLLLSRLSPSQEVPRFLLPATERAAASPGPPVPTRRYLMVSTGGRGSCLLCQAARKEILSQPKPQSFQSRNGKRMIMFISPTLHLSLYLWHFRKWFPPASPLSLGLRHGSIGLNPETVSGSDTPLSPPPSLKQGYCTSPFCQVRHPRIFT